MKRAALRSGAKVPGGGDRGSRHRSPRPSWPSTSTNDRELRARAAVAAGADKKPRTR